MKNESNRGWTKNDVRIKVLGWDLLYAEMIMFWGEKKQSRFGWTLNLNSASYSSESQFYWEDMHLYTSGAVFALAILFLCWFEDCKDERLQRERVSWKIVFRLSYLGRKIPSKAIYFCTILVIIEFGCSIVSSLPSASYRLQFSPESGWTFVSRIQKGGLVNLL